MGTDAWSTRRLPGSAVDLVRSRFTQLDAAAHEGDLRRAREVVAAVRREYVPAHDGMIHAIARALSHVARVHGSAEGEDFGFRVIEELQGRGDPPQYSQAGIKDRIRRLATGWHWHVTTFRLREDADRVTFELEPCGSGMRLVLEGAYLGEDALEKSEAPSRSNFMSTAFPNYSNHCSEMTRVALEGGSATFLVEGWTDRRQYGGCLQHTYKDISLVPDEFYRRVDLEPPVHRARPAPAAPLFSPEELAELETHPLDRLLDAIEGGDTEEAQRLVIECRQGWMDSIHDVCVNWYSVIWRQASDRYGEGYVRQMTRVAGPEFVGQLWQTEQGPSVEMWTSFWSIHGRLVDVVDEPAGFAFINEARSLIDTKRVDPDQFVIATNEGLNARGWINAGALEYRDGTLVHHVPATS